MFTYPMHSNMGATLSFNLILLHCVVNVWLAIINCGQDLTTCTLCTKYGPILMHTEGGV